MCSLPRKALDTSSTRVQALQQRSSAVAQAVEGPEECVPKQWAALSPGKAHPNYTTPKNCPGLAAPKLPKQVS